LAAIAIGEEFGISKANIKRALENYEPTNNRSQVAKMGTNRIVLDAYNANPTSMKLAIENFFLAQAENHVFILGDMLELGSYSKEEHQAILDYLKENKAANTLLVGPEFYQLKNDNFDFVLTNTEAKEWLASKKFENHTILIKGSRGIALEKVIHQD